MKFLVSLLLIAGLVFSCGNPSEENQNQSPTNDASIVFGDATYSIPELSAPAKIQVVKWSVLEDFLSEAKKVNGSNYQVLRRSSENLKNYSDSLFKNIPDTLNTRPINSRLVILNTRSQLLFQAAHQGSMDSLNLQNSVTALNVAVNNLVTHLNEKFQKDNIDFQRKEDEDNELKKQQSFRDSIMNLELQDQKQ